MDELMPIEMIERKIYVIRDQKVMLDRDLAELYGVKTFVLNQAVKRNAERFPADFMFPLTRQEIMSISQFVISPGAGAVKSIKFAKNVNAFTEPGLAMLSGVLNSPRAIKVNVAIMRAFIRLRKVLTNNRDLTYLFKELKHKVGQHDIEIGIIIKAMEKMIAAEKKPRGRIGFRVN